MNSVRTICVLGSTGSIGTQVLDVAARMPERICVAAIAGGNNIELLAKQASEIRPEVVVTATPEGRQELLSYPELSGIRVLCGDDGMCEAAAMDGVDMLVVGCQGFSGLRPTLVAAEMGKDIGLAAKEVLVSAGPVVREAVKKGGARMIPIDSEHSAVFQCMQGEREDEIDAVVLTASGGPFARASMEQLQAITPAMALNHPTWKMGRKITIDSATLMNKGLEIIEAEWLFGISTRQVEVVIHPKSIVHSLVRFRDGSVKAQIGLPDMRLPIQYALLYPERPDTGLPKLSLLDCGPLEFYEPDYFKFPALRLAREAAETGGTMPAVMSAANDTAVEAFLDEKIGFTQIADVVESVMEKTVSVAVDSLETAIEADSQGRSAAAVEIERLAALRV